MTKEEKIVGVTTITQGYRISLLKDVKTELEKDLGKELKEGDKIVYFVDKDGKIILKPA